MGVGDYVHSKEATQLRNPMNDAAPNHQLRQNLADQARVDVPATNLGPSLLPQANRQPESQGPPFPPAENAVQRDMFDTDVEGVDDSTVAATSVMGGDDVPYQFPRVTQPQHYSTDGNVNARSLHQFRQTRRPYDPKWYDNLGDRALKTAGFDSDDIDNESQLTSVVGDDEDSDETKSNHSQKRRGMEAPLSKRLQNFWSASRKPYPKNTSPVQEEPLKTTVYGQSTSETRAPNQALPITAPRKITLPHNMSTTPRTRFSPPKPSLLDKLELTPTRRASGPRPQPARKTGVSIVSPEPPGDDEGLFDLDYGRPGSVQSFNRFDITNLDALDDEDPINDPFARRNSVVRRMSPEPAQPKKRHLDLDYPPEVLRQKSFSELQAEPFDRIPSTTPPPTAPQTQVPSEDKISYLMEIPDAERRDYFSNLNMEEWEDCGDQLIEEFSKMLNQMKDLRRARRKTAATYEAEIKRRHDTVEEQSSDLTKKLEEMRTGGAEVLRGRTP
ncbi:uncharacterized protein LDX57_002317 [Aspergillus melleus]|uniref:uncharacterized protein n=1 Tax=Aspergillus melleus TaxID=138277 RepID=UPI001E8D7930|nr:uncharacterized protein LDX57_002317 [Aspergillus melleus]KAH8424570.1 hypothetical protein LDX57_002317 [Aspergillus melleus]